jgi:hypothetical protein
MVAVKHRRRFKFRGITQVTKPKPWRTDVGVAIGALSGALIWWNAYDPRAGLFQNPQFILVPAVVGLLIVGFRNKRKKVGPYDPEIIALNKRGRA